MYGICFIGFYDPMARICLVFVPVGLACAVILFYIFRGAHRLLSVSLSSSDFLSPGEFFVAKVKKLFCMKFTNAKCGCLICK
jgi:hypothetical protein